MKTAIVYYSKHHGNTKKLIDALAADHDITAIDASAVTTADLRKRRATPRPSPRLWPGVRPRSWASSAAPASTPSAPSSSSAAWLRDAPTGRIWKTSADFTPDCENRDRRGLLQNG